MRTQPKRNITKITKYSGINGNLVRKSYQNNILYKSPIFPKPLEYKDIDNAIFEFVDKELDIVIDGKLIPTYTLYSNQRFSEYSQMWEHSDENGNLYLNFKTVNRGKNPSFGENQGGYWNIPGRRKYTLLQREVLEDNGIGSYEVYTMKQPYAVNMQYTINFVTTTIDNLNKFNQKVNELFSSRQHYIRPNGHFIPMVLNEISDETSYSISDRKFYVQAVSVKLMAYIIEKKDFEVKKYPKRINTTAKGDEFFKNKSCVEVEETDNPMRNKTINVSITFQPFNSKSEFTFDTEMIIEEVYTENVRNFRLMVNDTLYYTEKGFKLHKDDDVRIQVRQINAEDECLVKFIGYSPNDFYNSKEIKEIVSEEEISHENIIID